MPSKDLISKKILKRILVEFSTQLFGLNIVDAEPLDTEQPRIEGKRADLRPLQKGIFLPPALFANAHLLFHKLRFAA